MSKSWKGDWNAFVDRVAFIGCDSSAVADEFAGHTVSWSGHLQERDVDDASPSVWMRMPERVIELDSTRYTLKDLYLPVRNGSADEWRRIDIGQEVSFEARFTGSESPFPPLEFYVLSSGRAMYTFRLADGTLR